MFIVSSYSLAVFLCFITMLCWGSWANTQKLATLKWPYQLYYWDYTIGVVLLSLILGLTAGSIGENGRPFLQDLMQADCSSYTAALAGGLIFNLSNLLLVAAIDIAGMAAAFPIGVGLALALGVLINYLKVPNGNPVLLAIGVVLVVVAIVVQALASKKVSDSKGKNAKTGIIVAILAGVIMSFFYRFVADSMSLNFSTPEIGKFTPYSAIFIFSLGVFISNFIFNSYFMRRPINGEKVGYKDYFTKGNLGLHSVGILGGVIWSIGMALSILAAEQAGPAISYGLGQGATLIAAIWGVFIWKEYKGAPKGINTYIVAMFLFFLVGLLTIIYAGM